MNTQSICTGLIICVAALITTAIAAQPASAYTVDDCIACHQDTTLIKVLPDGTLKSLHVDRNAYLKSIHGENGFTCIDCHDDARAEEHPAEGLARVECQSCHDDIAATHAESFHGKLLSSGNADAPQCKDCHTSHAVMKSDSRLSTVHPDNLRTTCGVCHKDQAAPVVCEAALDFAAGDMTALQRISLPSTLALMTARLKGHGKTDFSCSYSTKRCNDCHAEVGLHGGSTEQSVCAKCHDMQRSSLLFGKIHKPVIFTGPMIILLLGMYIVCIGGLILFFRKTSQRTKTSPPETPAQ